MTKLKKKLESWSIVGDAKAKDLEIKNKDLLKAVLPLLREMADEMPIGGCMSTDPYDIPDLFVDFIEELLK